MNQPNETYEILIKGEILFDWSDWFEHLTLSNPQEGITQLICEVQDQAALHGLLRKIQDLNLSLISVRKL